MKKILFVSPTFKKGGAEKILLTVANECSKRDFSVYVHSLTAGFDLLSFNPIINKSITRFKSNRLFDSIKKIKELRKYIKLIKPDLICAFTPLSTKISYVSSRFLNIPIVASERDDPLRRNFIRRSINGWFYSRCKKIVFQTYGALNCFHKGVKSKGVIISNPSEHVIPKNEDSINEHLILSASKLAPKKRFDVLLRAFKIVHEANSALTLLIYGEGVEKESISELIDVLDINDCVQLMGWSDNYFEKENPSIFVLSSESEGMPNVLIEAMSYGIPCISTDCSPGGARELFDDGECGVLSPKNDSSALANNILKLVDDKKQRKLLRNKALAKIQTMYPEKILKKWLDLFNSIINSNGE